MTKEVLTNKELAKAMNVYCPKYHLYEYEDFLDIFQEVIQQELIVDNTVKVSVLGTFSLKTSAAKRAWNINTKEWSIRPETYTVRFKPSYTFNKNVREAVHKLKETK